MSKVLQILGASTVAKEHIDGITYAIRTRCGELGGLLADAIVHDFENPEPSFRFDAMDLADVPQEDIAAAIMQLLEQLTPGALRDGLAEHIRSGALTGAPQSTLLSAATQIAEHMDDAVKRVLVSRLSAELVGLDPDAVEPPPEGSQAETWAQRIDAGPKTL